LTADHISEDKEEERRKSIAFVERICVIIGIERSYYFII
jgi:hypothetical protein